MRAVYTCCHLTYAAKLTTYKVTIKAPTAGIPPQLLFEFQLEQSHDLLNIKIMIIIIINRAKKICDSYFVLPQYYNTIMNRV